ncbi:unnamed protein product [Somion occarium]|uniref:DUF6534 domain-containing protein n=1 Tax=Somion occarium TaxID=3059160 RepID=A0ABP1D6U4_9APHY
MSALPTPGEVLGSSEIASCVAIVLYGIVVVQAYVYFLHYKEDPRWLKGLVGAVTFLETLHSVLIIHILYTFGVTDFGHLEFVQSITWSVAVSLLIDLCIIATVQGFYIRRIWILSNRSIWLVVILSTILFTRISFGIATFTLMLTLDNWLSFRQEIGPLFTVAFGIALALFMDFLIASVLIFYLLRNRSGLRRTDHIVTFLIAYAVNTGAITMVVSAAIVFTFVFLKSSLLFAGLNIASGKLYANSLLGTLNARQILRERHDIPSVTTNYFSNGSRASDMVFKQPIRVQNKSGSRTMVESATQHSDIEESGPTKHDVYVA